MNTQDPDDAAVSQIPADDYDSPWKEAVEHYFPELLAFYFPTAYAQIDWTHEPVFLDQELRAVVQDAELGKRFVDKLVRVMLRNGDERWVYIHIEVQGSRQAEFAKRMFVYNYRLFDRYDRPIASMAVLADSYTRWKPSCFGFELLGCKHSLEFPVAKLTDYAGDLDRLQTEENAFAYVTAAHILTQKTRKNAQDRFDAKRQLVRLLYERQWGKQRVIDLFFVIDSMMTLPAWLEQSIWQEITEIEEGRNMRYVSSVERIGIAKGRQEGLLEGEKKGLIEANQKTLRRLLLRRFKDMPEWVEDRITQATGLELEQWLDNILDATTIDAVFEPDATSH
jgi:hypothetical protein